MIYLLVAIGSPFILPAFLPQNLFVNLYVDLVIIIFPLGILTDILANRFQNNRRFGLEQEKGMADFLWVIALLAAAPITTVGYLAFKRRIQPVSIKVMFLLSLVILIGFILLSYVST